MNEDLSALELISCDELANLIHSGAIEKVLIVDCRSFLEFNTGNIVNSVNVCCSKLVKRRLQQNRVPIEEFLSQTCHVDADPSHEIVLCDQCTVSPSSLIADDNLVLILARRCRMAFKRVRLLSGGFLEFQTTHPSLCETKTVLQLPVTASATRTAGTPTSASSMTMSLSQPCMPVTNVGPTKILPYLFLGSLQDAMSAEVAQVNGITYVLNVSLSCPKPAHIQDGHFLRIPVNDNYSEKLLPYFHDAFQFLDKVREAGGRVLVHCLAGISRSPTLAIAYIMKCYHMTSEEAYRYVKDKRPTISPNFNFLGQLLEYERQIECESVLTPGGGGHKRRCLDDLRALSSCSAAETGFTASPVTSPAVADTSPVWRLRSRPGGGHDEGTGTSVSTASACGSLRPKPGSSMMQAPPGDSSLVSSRMPPPQLAHSPTAALANLRFESSIASGNCLPASPGGELQARIGRFPTVSLSQLSFTPCLVAVGGQLDAPPIGGKTGADLVTLPMEDSSAKRAVMSASSGRARKQAMSLDLTPCTATLNRSGVVASGGTTATGVSAAACKQQQHTPDDSQRAASDDQSKVAMPTTQDERPLSASCQDFPLQPDVVPLRTSPDSGQCKSSSPWRRAAPRPNSIAFTVCSAQPVSDALGHRWPPHKTGESSVPRMTSEPVTSMSHSTGSMPASAAVLSNTDRFIMEGFAFKSSYDSGVTSGQIKLTSARTVPSDLDTIKVMATVENRLRATSSREMCSPQRKSRSLEDILSSPDREVLIRSSGSGCWCRRRSALVTTDCSITMPAAAADCRCRVASDPPLTLRGQSSSSVSSSGGSRGSLHSSLEVIQVS